MPKLDLHIDDAMFATGRRVSSRRDDGAFSCSLPAERRTRIRSPGRRRLPTSGTGTLRGDRPGAAAGGRNRDVEQIAR